MLIRYGYEMTFACPAPTPMICQLDVHPSCLPAVRAETPFAASPHVESWLYADVFGNRCRRFNAPAGDLTISNAGVIEVSGRPDPVIADAHEIPVADLPDETLLYLVGSRYVETDKLSQETNSDRVEPQFVIGMDDNTIPIPSLPPDAPDAPKRVVAKSAK